MNKIELCKDETCTQCYACVTTCPKQCISMKDGKDGFLLPSIDRENCIECGACLKACHQITPKINYQRPLKTYACWTKQMFDRKNSSSGGAFSVIARKILSENGIVYGATMDKDLKVFHIGIESPDKIILLQGSKYVQSYLGDTYRQVKDKLVCGRKVLFMGTPCQVAGLRTYLRHDYDNLFTCDVVCHGVPSPKAFDIYIDKIGLKGKCEKINFRFTEGWGFQLSFQIKSPSKAGDLICKELISPKNSYYLRAFAKGLMFSEACYNCAYAKLERVSDITLADYWGLGVIKPFNYPTHRGVSLMLVNTERALSLVSGCPDFFYVERPLEEAVKGNYNLSHVSNRPEGRDTYFEDSIELSIITLSRKYGIKASLRDYFRVLKQKINSMR